jgi:hypothetical protein
VLPHRLAPSETHSRTPYPSAKPTIRAIAISGIKTTATRQRHGLPSVAVVDLSEEMARARDGAPAIAQHLRKFVSPRG